MKNSVKKLGTKVVPTNTTKVLAKPKTTKVPNILSTGSPLTPKNK